jgi:hypothetical protein
VEQRNNGSDGEIDVLQLIARLVQNLTERQGDQFQLGIQALGLGGGEGG